MTKIETAKQIIREGGHFRYRLERNWKGREQFATRLISASGDVIKGFGHAVMYALRDTGFIVRDRTANYGSTAQEIYRAERAS